MDLLLWTVFGQHWVGKSFQQFPTQHPCTHREQGSEAANKPTRRSAGHCRIILLGQPSHSAEYMLNSAAGWGPSTSFPSRLKSQQCVCRSCPAQPGCWALSALPSPCSSSIWKSTACAAAEEPPLLSPHSTRHWPPTPPEGGLGPPAEQVPTN